MNLPSAATSLSGHEDRPVVMRRSGGRAVVVKMYRDADGGRIFEEHRRLWESPLGVSRPLPGIPEPYRWDPSRRELAMEAIDGQPLGARGDLGLAPQRVGETARLLADLHTSGVLPRRRRPAARVVLSLVRKQSDLADHEIVTDFSVALVLLTRVLDECAISASESLVPSHGDWSPRNVLVEARGVRMIDLDRLQLAGAGRDVGYWGAWAFATLLIRGDTPDWSLGTSFAAAYLAVRPDARAELEATLGFHTAAGLLRIAHGWSALRDQPAAQRAIVSAAVGLAEATLSGGG